MISELFTFEAKEVLDFSIKIGIATVSGLLIGLEREYKGKSAGLKTNALVAIGSAVDVLISLKFQGEDYADIPRVLSQVVTGIGFVGVGVLVQKKDTVKGLRTAPTVWCSAGAGCFAATSMFFELIVLTLLVIIINLVFGYLDLKINK